MSTAHHDRPSPPPPDGRLAATSGQVPVVGRIFPAPIAAKVPEVVFLFWVVKILTTAGGEATSDYLRSTACPGRRRRGGAIRRRLGVGNRHPPVPGIRVLFLALPSQSSGRACPTSSTSTSASPTQGRRCCGRSSWPPPSGSGNTARARCLSTASRPSDAKPSTGRLYSRRCLAPPLGTSPRRPCTSATWPQAILFGVVILLPALAWKSFGLNSIAAFWMSYVVTRPLGASFADY